MPKPRPTYDSNLTLGASKKLLSSSLGAILEFTGGEEKGREVPLIFEKTILGRKHGDVLVRDIKVSSTHVAVDYRAGKFRVIDLGSSNGTFVDKQKIKETVIEVGQEVRIGDTLFLVKLDPSRAAQLMMEQPVHVNPPQGGLTDLLNREFVNRGEEDKTLAAHGLSDVAAEDAIQFDVISGPDRGKRFSFTKREVSIGRVNADIVLNDSDVSRKHAIIERSDGDQIVLRDLASSNGTFVNERKISSCLLVPNDRIRVGQTILHYRVSKAT